MCDSTSVECCFSVDSGCLIRGRNGFLSVFLCYLCVAFGCAMLIYLTEVVDSNSNSMIDVVLSL